MSEKTWYNGSFAICPKQSLNFFPFKLYLALEYQIYDYTQLKPYRRLQVYFIYRSFCVGQHLHFEAAKNFGLDTV